MWLMESDIKLATVDFRLFEVFVKSVLPWGNLMTSNHWSHGCYGSSSIEPQVTTSLFITVKSNSASKFPDSPVCLSVVTLPPAFSAKEKKKSPFPAANLKLQSKTRAS